MKAREEKVAYEQHKGHDGVFYGEVGVERYMPIVLEPQGVLWDGDYDRDNPEGTAWGRRNYQETCYLSGMPDLNPDEYADEEATTQRLDRIS